MAGSLNSDYSDDAAPMSEINVTPLVDVVLVLLIVFMITVPLMMSAAPIKVDLPPAATGEAATDKQPKSLEIFLRQEDSGEVAVMIGDQRVPEDLLDAALESMPLPDKSLPVHVAADRHLPYEKVIHVIDVLRGLGFEKVGLDTNPVPKKSQ